MSPDILYVTLCVILQSFCVNHLETSARWFLEELGTVRWTIKKYMAPGSHTKRKICLTVSSN